MEELNYIFCMIIGILFIGMICISSILLMIFTFIDDRKIKEIKKRLKIKDGLELNEEGELN